MTSAVMDGKSNMGQAHSVCLWRLKLWRLTDKWSAQTYWPDLAVNKTVISSHTVRCDSCLTVMIKSQPQHSSSGNIELIKNQRGIQASQTDDLIP